VLEIAGIYWLLIHGNENNNETLLINLWIEKAI
jgi:hypothetical protein